MYNITDMNLTPRQLALLEHEMGEIKNDSDRDSEDRSHASSILSHIEGELEWEEEQHDELNGNEATELFS
jgi:hypothetical protein